MWLCFRSLHWTSTEIFKAHAENYKFSPCKGTRDINCLAFLSSSRPPWLHLFHFETISTVNICVWFICGRSRVYFPFWFKCSDIGHHALKHIMYGYVSLYSRDWLLQNWWAWRSQVIDFTGHHSSDLTIIGSYFTWPKKKKTLLCFSPLVGDWADL